MDLITENIKWIFSGIGNYVLRLIVPKATRTRQGKIGDIIINADVITVHQDYKTEDRGKPPETSLDLLVRRFFLVFHEHGISTEQMSSFIDKKFGIRIADLDENNLRTKLTDELLDWTCAKFGIQRKWFDNQDENIYQSVECYKRPYTLIEIISSLVDEVGLYNIRSDIQMFITKDFSTLEADRSNSNGRITFILAVKIGKSSSGEIFRYILINDNLFWSYHKSRHDVKRMIAICDAFGIVIHGFDLSRETVDQIGQNNVFPHKILKKLLGYTWYLKITQV